MTVRRDQTRYVQDIVGDNIFKVFFFSHSAYFLLYRLLS